MTPQQEEAFGCAWKRLAVSEGHQPLLPHKAGDYIHPRRDSKIDMAFGDGSKAARLGHSGLTLSEIAAAHGMKPASLNSWFAKHDLNLGKLLAKFPKQEEAA